MRRLIIIVLSIVLAIGCMATSVAAHDSTDRTYKYYETVNHWVVNEDGAHWASYSTAMTVNCGDFTGTDFETYIKSAVTKWNSATFNGSKLISMSVNNTSGCVYFENADKTTIKDLSGSETTWAITYRTGCTKNSTTKHISTSADSIRIKVNWSVLSAKSTTAKTHVPLHELGHVIGLDDISNKASYNAYLMCNEFGSNYSAPTTITTDDIKGAAFILGLHTKSDHVLSSTKSYHNSTYHRQPCTVCGAYLLETHSYSNGVCTKCGHKSS